MRNWDLAIGTLPKGIVYILLFFLFWGLLVHITRSRFVGTLPKRKMRLRCGRNRIELIFHWGHSPWEERVGTLPLKTRKLRKRGGNEDALA